MIDTSVLEKLEFQKVLNSISNYAVTENGKKNILYLTPSTDLKKITLEGQSVKEAKEILIRNNPPQLDYIPDLFEALAQSKIEGVVLNSKKIIEILKLAKISRVLYQFLKSNSETTSASELLRESPARVHR